MKYDEFSKLRQEGSYTQNDEMKKNNEDAKYDEAASLLR